MGARRRGGLVQLPRARGGRLPGTPPVRAVIERFLGAFEEVRIELDDPEEIEDGVLVVENVSHLPGRDGIEVQARSAWLITIREGKHTSLTLYQTKQDALEAAGPEHG